MIDVTKATRFFSADFSVSGKFWYIKSEEGTEQSGNTVKGLINVIDYYPFSTYIILNAKLENFIDELEKWDHKLGINYNTIFNGAGEIQGITLINVYGKKIFFRDIKHYFNCTFKKGIKENVEEMQALIIQFSKLIRSRNFFATPSLEKIMSNDFKEKVNWEENFNNKISPEMFKKLENWKQGAFNYVNPQFKDNVVKGNFYDKNSFYQSIWANNKMPIGKPIHGHNLIEKPCNHSLILVKIQISAKLRPRNVPCLANTFRKDEQIINKTRAITSCTRKIFYVTFDKLVQILESYEIIDNEFLILDQYCFDYYKGDGFAKFNQKWIDVKNKINNLEIKSLIKKNINKILGIQAPVNINSYYRVFGEYYDGQDKKVIPKKWQITKSNVPYIPLYIFVTDGARNYMYQVCNYFYENLIMCSTDGVAITSNISTQKFGEKYEIHSTKIGAFKVQFENQFYYVKGVNSYLAATSVNTRGDIKIYKHSGISKKNALRVEKLSLKDVIDLSKLKRRVKIEK